MPKPELKLEQFSFHVPVAVRWSDMDTLGHVNNANFFSYDEIARLSYFNSLMRDDAKFWKDYGLILARTECDFVAQLKAPAMLDVGFRIARIGSSSMQTEGAMFQGGKLIAVTRAVVVWFDYTQNKALPVPDSVRAMIHSLERIKPEN